MQKSAVYEVEEERRKREKCSQKTDAHSHPDDKESETSSPEESEVEERELETAFGNPIFSSTDEKKETQNVVVPTVRCRKKKLVSLSLLNCCINR